MALNATVIHSPIEFLNSELDILRRRWDFSAGWRTDLEDSCDPKRLRHSIVGTLHIVTFAIRLRIQILINLTDAQQKLHSEHETGKKPQTSAAR